MRDMTPAPDSTAAYWDEEAATFDDAADHGLRDPEVRLAWRQLLLAVLPEPPATVADLGAGTGSLACLLGHEGFTVRGVDISPGMVDAARAKAAASGVPVEFEVGDASDPALPRGGFDVVLVRHLLWALPDAAGAVARWVQLLRPHGRVVLVEGRWHTGAGLTAAQAGAIVAQHLDVVEVRRLTDPRLWGGPTGDERYLLVGECA